ncbi:MAG: MFS transporter [Gammaproteobacteria bacterium]
MSVSKSFSQRRRVIARESRTSQTLHHSVDDGMAFSAMSGGGETYFTAFALFLRATAGQVALLSTLPALIGSLAQLLSVWLERRLQHRKTVVLAGALFQACVWLPLAVLAMYPPVSAAAWLLLLFTLYYGAGHLTLTAWTSLMGDIVPVRRRSRYFAYRTSSTNMISFVALVLAGCILHVSDQMSFTWAGFVAIFLLACACRMLSAWHIGAMHEPERHRHKTSPVPDVRAFAHMRAFRFSGYIVLMQCAVAIASPFFAVYMLRDLRFSYFEFMVNTGTAVLVQFITLNRWGRIGDVFGNRLILVITGMLIPLMPLLWVVSGNYWYLFLIQACAGLAWGGFNLSAGNLLYELVPSPQRAAYVALHNVFTALGVFAGAMLGATLLQVLPERTTFFGDHAVSTMLLNVFLVSTAIRLLVSACFLHRIRETGQARRPMSARQFIFRVSRFNAFLGLYYDLVADSSRDKKDSNH